MKDFFVPLVTLESTKVGSPIASPAWDTLRDVFPPTPLGDSK